MNYFAPLLLSLFIHFGIGLSFSNILKIDFDAFNIDSKKPITAFVIFEEAISIPRQKIKADQVTKISDKPKLEIEKIELESKKDLLSEIQQLENLKINDQAYTWFQLVKYCHLEFLKEAEMKLLMNLL